MSDYTEADIDHVRNEAQAILDLARDEDRDLTEEEGERYDAGLDWLERRADEAKRQADLAKFAALEPADYNPMPAPAVHVQETSRAADQMAAYETSRIRPGDPAAERSVFDQARSLADEIIPDPDARQNLERMLGGAGVSRGGSQGSAGAGGDVARHVLLTGNEHYRSFFVKWVQHKQTGLALDLTPDERRAQEAVVYQMEMERAMNVGTPAAGGYMVPTHLDDAIMLSNDGAQDGVSGICRTETLTMANEWNGVTSAGVTVEYGAEASEVNDNSPTLGTVNIPVHRGQAYVAASIEVQQDTSFVSQLPGLIADGKAIRFAESLVVGTGTGQPTGIATALVGVSQTTGAVDYDALRTALFSSVGPRWRGRSQWLMNDGVSSAIPSIFIAAGHDHPPQYDSRGQTVLWGRSVNPASYMGADHTNNGDHAAIVGDFQQYIHVLKLGGTIDYIPHVMGANQRPTGESGWVHFFRHGADVAVPEAFQLLTVGP